MVYKDGHVYEGDWLWDFMHGEGCWTDPEGNVYKGDFAGDSRTGHGKIAYKNKDYYEGTFLLNKREGKGSLRTEDIEYSGEFMNDKIHGFGVMYFGEAKNLIYKGHFKEGVKHGNGELTTPDNKKIKTTWTNGKKNGRFVLETPDSFAEGVFKDDELVGDITTKFANGDIYVGNSLNSYREGKGRMVWANHKTLKFYEGNFLKNKMHGSGLLEMKNGLVYEGEMKENKISGKGKMKNEKFEAIGAFEDGKPVGEFKIVYQNGDEYVGQVDNFRRDGKGKLVKKNGIVYEGEYKGGKMHGSGVLDIEGKRYKGEWKEGKREGKFLMIDLTNNDQYEVQFENDKRSSQVKL